MSGSIAFALALVIASPSLAQLNQNCSVSISNRTSPVAADGSWRLENLPANTITRARAVCSDGTTIRLGAGKFYPLLVGENGFDSDIAVVAAPPPIPVSLRLTSPKAVLTRVGEVVSLTASAIFSNGGSTDVTNNGTTYTSSNPAVVTIAPNGAITATGTGVAILTALHEGAIGFVQIVVATDPNATDSDGDGMPDKWETDNGLDPQNAADAPLDGDADGLSNVQEFNAGSDPRKADTDGDGLNDGNEVARQTNPSVADTDGDGIPDGLEVQTATNPLDASSFNLAATIRLLMIRPNGVSLIRSLLVSDAPAVSQLTVVARLIDDKTEIDLTSRSKGTTYSIANPQIASFGAVDGLIIGGVDGSTTLTASNSGFTATIGVNSGGTTGFVNSSAVLYSSGFGYAVNLATNGMRVHVAGVYTGVATFAFPLFGGGASFVATRYEGGWANDMAAVSEQTVYSVGDSYLHVVDYTTPGTPQGLSYVWLGADAYRVAQSGNVAYVACGVRGLCVVDVTDRLAPLPVARLALGGTTKVVAAEGTRVITLTQMTAGSMELAVIDAQNGAAPQILGRLTLPGTAEDVAYRDGYAYVAARSGGFHVVDTTLPSTPRVAGSILPGSATASRPRRVRVARNLALVADPDFQYGIAFIDIANPAAPALKGTLSYNGIPVQFDPFRRFNNPIHVALNGHYFAVIGAAGDLGQERPYGTNGYHAIFTGRYTALPNPDFTLEITSPQAGSSVTGGEMIRLAAQPTLGIGPRHVNFFVNGVNVCTASTPPFQCWTRVPATATSLKVEVTSPETSFRPTPSVTIPVTPPPFTTATGRVIDRNGQPVAGVTVRCLGATATTGADGSFAVSGIPANRGFIGCTMKEASLEASSSIVAPIAGGQTLLGELRALPVGEMMIETWEDENGGQPTASITTFGRWTWLGGTVGLYGKGFRQVAGATGLSLALEADAGVKFTPALDWVSGYHDISFDVATYNVRPGSSVCLQLGLPGLTFGPIQIGAFEGQPFTRVTQRIQLTTVPADPSLTFRACGHFDEPVGAAILVDNVVVKHVVK